MENIEKSLEELNKLKEELQKSQIDLKKTQELKKQIKKIIETKLFKLKELIIPNDKEILFDQDKIDFALKIIEDEAINKDIESLIQNRQKDQKKEDLNVLENNIKTTSKQIIEILSNLKPSRKKESSIPIFRKIKKKYQAKKDKEIIASKLDKIIEIIENSKQNDENKNIKESLFEKEDMNGTLNVLYKKCRIRDISNMSEIKQVLSEKYNRILLKIKREKEKENDNKQSKNSFDYRLKEYVYDKKENYISYILDHKLGKYKNHTTYDLAVEIIKILKQISDIENTKTNIKVTYMSNDTNQKERIM